jgi:hypothetical protein
LPRPAKDRKPEKEADSSQASGTVKTTKI